MDENLIPFGEPLSDLEPGRLNYAVSRKVLFICEASEDFEVVQLRSLLKNDKVWDVIVVDCVNDQVPSRNAVGIKVREPLALAFTADTLPDVRALRKDFPSTVPHLNHVSAGEPLSLCLYYEPWGTLERTWTAQKHLQRILWWLSETSKEKLHKDDQPLEPLYFESPFQIVLPVDFEEKMEDPSLVLVPMPVLIGEHPQISFKLIRARFLQKTEIQAQESSQNRPPTVPIVSPISGPYVFNIKSGIISPVVKPVIPKIMRYDLLPLKAPPVVHGVIEQYPNTLGQLHDQIERRGKSIYEKLTSVIKDKAQGGVSRDALSRCLLILWVPMKRSSESEAQTNVYAFETTVDLATLGERIGILEKDPGGKFYPLLGGASKDKREEWRQIEVFPIALTTELDKGFARIASGINTDTADFAGILGGVGALGSTLAELWSKEHWGQWSFIDSDFIKPHNVVRHIAKDMHVGSLKVEVVKQLVEMNYPDGYYKVSAVPANAQNIDAERVKDIFARADLFVDATTTIEVPRDVSQREEFPRSVSVFLTPSGQGSVLLMESADRSLRLDALEAQYYRGIIDSDWGVEHLYHDKADLRTGPGCRDISAVISNEAIQLHAALLARQIRLLRDRPESHIRVWSYNGETGALSAHEVSTYPAEHFRSDDWQVILDYGTREKLGKLRNKRLPSETGGVILGYIDQKLRHIYVVDVLSAPPDSDEDRTGFTRGVKGLKGELEEVARRTRNIVGYLGEWHSHPAFTSPYPSETDRELIEQLSRALELDGQPALMVIVGSAGEISLSVRAR